MACPFHEEYRGDCGFCVGYKIGKEAGLDKPWITSSFDPPCDTIVCISCSRERKISQGEIIYTVRNGGEISNYCEHHFGRYLFTLATSNTILQIESDGDRTFTIL